MDPVERDQELVAESEFQSAIDYDEEVDSIDSDDLSFESAEGDHNSDN